MRLRAFSVSNYRSITRANALPVADSTVLLGQNNEGKSNLLSALATAMTIVSSLAKGRLIKGRIRLGLHRKIYQWDADYPISRQEAHPDGESVFRLEFQLTEEERSEFKTAVGSNLNESLPIEIRIGRRDPSFKVIKKGPGSKTLNRKSQEIAAFIGGRVEVTYIPAVRTAQKALSVVQDMVSRELATLEDRVDYQRAVKKIADLQNPVLQKISKQIQNALQEFLPNVASVDVSVSERVRFAAMRRNVEVTVDDGTPTALARKGDGVQSLAAISLLRGTNPTKRQSILALEEPESHLHPRAIHRLRSVIDELSRTHQVVLTTHCPLFVDRVNTETNIVVTGSKATPAKSLDEIREVLGVRASDNLRHASLVLVVEGSSDARIVRTIASSHSAVLRAALKSNTLAIEHLHGAGKLTYKLSELTNALCNHHTLLDNDDAGRRAGDAALAEGLTTTANVNYITCPGMANSEIEDLIQRDVYADWIDQTFGVDIRKPTFRGNRKWSDRMSRTFEAQGKQWNKANSLRAKDGISEIVANAPHGALIETKTGALVSLLERLEARLQGK